MRQKLLIGGISVVLTAMPASKMAENVYAAVLDSYIVVLNDDVANVPAIANEHAQYFGGTLQFRYAHALKGYTMVVPPKRGAQFLAQIKHDPRVAFISEVRPVWAMAQTLPTGVNRIEGDMSSTVSGDGVGSVNAAVAVIDTGIRTNHVDLKVAGGKNCNGFFGIGSFNDGNGHGTHVAGTIGARDNATAVVGVAPDTPLYAVRVLNNSGSGSTAQVICGIDWVTGRRAEFNDGASDGDAGIKIDVANMSLGGSGSDDSTCGNSNNDAMHKAICNSVATGVTYVVAAGNNNADLQGFVPAAYNEVLTVTAMADFNGQPGGGAAPTCRADVDDTAADFSNWTTVGNAADVLHTIAAPGVCILSTWRTSTTAVNTISGTSMAAPHVAGTVALCIASGDCAGLSPSAIIAKLRADAALQAPSYGFTGDPNSPIGNRYYGHLAIARDY